MKRNYGIDALRLVSMFMVTMLHVLAQGGILYATEPGSLSYWVVWATEIACYCAVNCFALISGYTMSQTQYKVSRLFKVWFHTVFYTVLGVVFFLFFKPEVVGKKDLVYALFPVSGGLYWYVSAYFGLLILTPLLNTILKHTEKRVLGMTLLAAFVVFCVLPVPFQSNPYKLDKGYSLIWLCLLYLGGGYLRKYDLLRKIKTSHAWFTVLGAYGLTILSKFVIEQIFGVASFFYDYRNALILFTSPTTVLIAVGLLVLFSKIKFGRMGVGVVRVLSPAALGVYLSHTHPLVWEHLLKGSTMGLAQRGCLLMVYMLLSVAFLIFLGGLVLDLLRIKLFQLLRIDKLCTRWDTK